MLLTPDIDHRRRRVVTVAAGPLTCPDLVAHLAALAAAGAAGYPELVDARGTTVPADVTLEAVMRAGGLLRDRAAGRVAVLTNVPATYGVVCQLSVFAAAGCAVRPFRDAGEAREWLQWD